MVDVSRVFDCAAVEDQDLVSRYLARKLSPEEAEAFEEHYFGCDRCWAEVQRATELRAALEEKGAFAEMPGVAARSHRVIRGPWRIWVPLAAAAGIAVAVGLGLFLASYRDASVTSLARAASEAPYRSLEGRLIGPFRYLSPEPVMRGTVEPSTPLDLRRASLEAQKRAQDSPSAQTLRASALGHLLTGELDPAIAQLEEAKKLDPKNVAILSDLAAAYLARAHQKSGSEEGNAAASDFEAALAAANAALDREPRSPEARFNKALILEAQHLREEAAAAWRAYLEVDGSSPWAAEARQHLEKLTALTESELWEKERKSLDAGGAVAPNQVDQLARRFPQQIRVYVQDDVLPKWGDAYLAGNRARAASLLDMAGSSARALQASSGDSLLAESISVIEAASSKADSAAVLQDLARGHSSYGEARGDYQKLAIASAAAAFETSRSLLARSGSPFQAHAALGGVTCLVYQNALRPGLDVLDGLIESEAPNGDRHLSLLGHAHWYRGFVRLLLGYPHEALEEDRRALALFDRLGEKENSAAIHGNLSEDYQYVGDAERSWMHLDRALSLLDELGTVPRRPVWLASAARAHSTAGHRELAALFQSRLVAEAESTGKADTIADALLSSAITLFRAGRPAQAGEELIRARKALAAIPDADVRRRTEANLDLSEITLASHGHSEGDIQRLTDALAFFEAADNHLGEAQLYLERGRMWVLRGDSPAARADFEKGIEEFERQRMNLADESVRIQYFDTGRHLYESEIRLLAANKDVEGSFLYADRAHGRALLDDLRAIPGRGDSAVERRTAGSLVLSDLPGLVPDGTAVVEFLMLPGELITWVARPGRVEIASAPVAEGRVQGFIRQLDSSREDLRSSRTALGELHDILIAPIATLIAETPHLIFVPDRDLNRVPFSALLNVKTGMYLIETHDITIAPSAATFLHLRDRAPPTDGEPSVLVVAGPPSAPISGLRRLERVQEECRRISALYPRSLVLSGDRATRTSFRDFAPSYSIIHFAGHAVANLTRPALSMLVLTPDERTGDSGYLYSHEFSAVNFGGVQLVVLGACSTAAGRTSASEGMLGLARSFLSAGVPAIVASLWPVEDELTSRLMPPLHERLHAGDAPSQALRLAQLELLHSPEGIRLAPPLWAAFQLYGTSLPTRPKGGHI
jgi:CHAT domain-containing protein/tetratricopeptide (TPR) repeat protein